MNVLHIAPHYGGGVGSVAVDLAKYLKTNHGVVNRFVAIDLPLNSVQQHLEQLCAPRTQASVALLQQQPPS